MNQKPWSSQEIEKLVKYYPDLTNEELSFDIPRTPAAIAHKANRLKLKKSYAFLNSPVSGRFRVRVSFWKWFFSLFKRTAAC